MTLNAQQHLFTSDLATFLSFAISYCDENNILFQPSWLKRDNEIQAKMVANGLSKTLDSKHLISLAFDFNIIKDGKFCQDIEVYRPLGEFWKELNTLNVWGGDWTDPIDMFHIERKRL